MIRWWSERLSLVHELPPRKNRKQPNRIGYISNAVGSRRSSAGLEPNGVPCNSSHGRFLHGKSVHLHRGSLHGRYISLLSDVAGGEEATN
jgi:hypothetical protein